MPLTASDFKLLNPTPQNIAALNATLSYAAQNANLDGIMQMAADRHVAILFNGPGDSSPLVPPGDVGNTEFGNLPSGEPVIIWNPSAATVVWMKDSSGNLYVTGIQSAADGRERLDQRAYTK